MGRPGFSRRCRYRHDGWATGVPELSWEEVAGGLLACVETDLWLFGCLGGAHYWISVEVWVPQRLPLPCQRTA